MAGCSPAAVICEIMKDDGTMARLPDLLEFAAVHGLKIGTIADLIEHRSRNESLIERIGSRSMQTHWGEFTAQAYRDAPSGQLHLALIKGTWRPEESIAARVHEPLSLFDALETGRTMHSWSLDETLRFIASEGRGIAVLLNCGESPEQLMAQFEGRATPSHGPGRGRMDLRSYGIGTQILLQSGVRKMRLLGNPRRMPSMAGYGLEITGYVSRDMIHS
jgi:3,4-dihydroxy 2-butanone 4-phosphate synthase/GTP cyclohydrolase II